MARSAGGMKHFAAICIFLVVLATTLLVYCSLSLLIPPKIPAPSVSKDQRSTNGTRDALWLRDTAAFDAGNYFNFYNFEAAITTDAQGQSYSLSNDYKAMFSHVLLEVYTMLGPTITVMQEQKSLMLPNHPSYNRYFKGSQKYALNVYTALLGVALGIGLPGLDRQRAMPACPQFPKLDIWYNTPSDSINPPRNGRLQCVPFRQDGVYSSDPPFAFRFTKWQDGQIIGDGIALCEQFFRYFRGLQDVEKDKSYMGTYLEMGYPDGIDEPTFTTAMLFLHELLHVPGFYAKLGFPLQDYDYDTGQMRTMYRSITDLAFRENTVTPNVLLPAYGAHASRNLNNGYAAYWNDETPVPMTQQDPPYPSTWCGPL